MKRRFRLLSLLAGLGVWLAGSPAAPAQSSITNFAGLAGVPGGADGSGSSARFNSPTAVAVDAAGNVHVVESVNNTLRVISALGDVTTLAGTAGAAGSTDSTNSAARFRTPSGVAVDAAGNIYVADYGNHTIRKVTASGTVTTFAGLAGSAGSTDGPGAAARFNGPAGVAVDASGNVYVADTSNSTIRKLTPGGVVTTLAGTAGAFGATDGTGAAARFFLPFGVAVDSSGTVYVADTYNQTIRKVTAGGVVTTLAGTAGSPGSTDGLGPAARFRSPRGVAVDSSGSVFVADFDNEVLRKINPAGEVLTLAGSAGVKGSADADGPGARFRGPAGIAVDVAGNVYIADSGNHTVRRGLKPTAPAISVQPVSQTIVPGGTVQFYVTATGGGTLYYQWRKDGTNLVGQNTSSLQLVSVPTNQAGAYSVVVSNTTASVVSQGALLAFYTNFTNTVLAGVARSAITGQPLPNVLVSVAGTNVVTGLGGTFHFNAVPALPVTLLATATGHSPFSDMLNLLVGVSNHYEFAVSPQLLDANSFRIVLNWGALPRELDAHLATPLVGGNYYDVTWNRRGSLATAPFTALDVDVNFGYGPETITVTNFSPGVYTYYVDHYYFPSDGSIVGCGATARIYTSSGLLATLTVPTAGAGQYWYVCEIDGLTRQVTILNRLSNAPPAVPSGPAAIAAQPQSITGIAGSNVNFSVVAGGGAPVAFQWRRDGTNITDATNAVLTLPFLSRASAGTFSVVVSNALGGETSASALLRVVGATQFDPLQFQPGVGARLRFSDLGGFPLNSQFASGFEVQFNTNLLTTNWVRLTNGFQFSNGKIELDDPGALQQPRRFYRVLER